MEGQYLSKKKIYTIKVKGNRNYNAFQHMNTYDYLQQINKAVKSMGYDIEIVEVKYVQTKSRAQKGFQMTDGNRYDFQVQKDKNVVFGTEHQFLDWIFADAITLKKPDNVEAGIFDDMVEQQKKRDEEKKLTDIQNFLQNLMQIFQQTGSRRDQSKKKEYQIISFSKFKMYDHNCFKDGDYDMFVKAKMSEPVRTKLDQEKQMNKAFVINRKNVQIKSYFHPTANQQSGDKVQELALINQFTLGCTAPQDTQRSTCYYYYDSTVADQNIRKYNNAVALKSYLSLNRQNGRTNIIKSFQIQTYYFNQSIIKTQVNMGQIKKIQIFNDRTQSGVIEYYFHLAYPPKYFISQLKKQVANVEQYMTNWQRIQNIFFLRHNKINNNQFLRLYLFNNTILRISIQKSKFNSMSDFQRPEQMLASLVQKFDDKISIPINRISSQINFSKTIRNLQKSFDYEKTFVKSLQKVQNQNKVWILKYFILIIVRYDHLYPKEVARIISEIQENHDDLEIYIYVFWKIATDIWGYTNKDKRFADYLFDQVKSAKALNRIHMMKKIIQNSDLIAHVFRMNSAPSGYLYAAPTPQMKGRLLKQYSNQSQYFLRVSVCDDHQGTLKNQKYITKCAMKKRMLQFQIIDRKYIPLGWSPSQLRSYSLWYIHQTDAIQNNRRINRQIVLNFLGSFSQIENPAKRAARIGQSFSSSWNYDARRIKSIKQDDIITSTGYNFTDGIGKISQDLIESISLKLGLSNLSVIQVRYKGAKGIFVVDQTLPKNTVVLRPSMVKYKCEKQSAAKYLDILDYNKYKSGFLNRQIIILLKTLKINDVVFEGLQKSHIQAISKMSFKDCSVFKQMNQDLNTQINNLEPANKTILELVRAGFDLENQPFFRGVLETMKKNGYNQLKNKCNIRVDKSARIIGIIDQFGILNQKQVYCAIFDPFSNKKESQKLQVIEGPAIITRNPCLDPADIRIVNCVGKQQIAARFQQIGLSNKFQKFVNCVIFPQKGPIPLTAQISGSDLDGDNFFICWDQVLIPKQERKINTIDNPTKQVDKKKVVVEKRQDEMYTQMLDFFFEYINYEKLGQIDNSHLVKADQDLTNYADNKQCMELCEIHGKAVDFPKTGYCPPVDPKLLVSVYPDFMQKQNAQQYASLSILGKLYRQIKQKIQDLLKDKVYKGQQKIDVDLIRKIQINFTKEQIKQAMQTLLQYQKSIYNLINLVGIDTEYEIYSGNFSIAKQKVDQYGKTRLISTILQLRQRYFTIFFDGLNQDEDNYQILKQDDLIKEDAFSHEAKRKAVLYYIVSYIYKFGHKIKFEVHEEKFEKIRSCVELCLEQRKRIDKQGKFCGFIWFVIPKIIISLKRTAIKERNFTQKNTQEKDKKVNEGQKQQGNDSEQQKQFHKNINQDEEVI